MGEPTCLMRPVAYAAILSAREPAKENPIHALSQSISFGRFMSESLAWERWSTFTSKKYVEEAERFAQPGSVAEKKAFFEAHYKRMAAKKQVAALLAEANAAAAAAAASENAPEGDLPNCTENDKEDSKTESSKSSVSLDEMETMENGGAAAEAETYVFEENEMNIESEDQLSEGFTSEEEHPKSNLNEPPMEIPSLKVSESNQETLMPKIKEEGSVTPIDGKILVEYTNKKKSTLKWLKPLRITPLKEFNKFSLTVKKKIDHSRMGRNTTEGVNGASKYTKASPRSDKRTSKSCTAIAENKSSGRRCSPLAIECSKFLSKCTKKMIFSTPCRLRNEEKAARRKKEKVEKKPNRWCYSFCFNVGSLPTSPRENAIVKDRMNKMAIARTHPRK